MRGGGGERRGGWRRGGFDVTGIDDGWRSGRRGEEEGNKKKSAGAHLSTPRPTRFRVTRYSIKASVVCVCVCVCARARK